MKGVSESLLVQLDAPASKLLRRYTNGRRFPCLHRHADPRDVASAAMIYFLADTQKSTAEELRTATARRERTEGRAVVQQHPPVAVGIDVEAAALLARYCRQTGQDARDVASGMLYALLAGELYDADFDAGECIASARSRRASRAQRTGGRKVGKPRAAVPTAALAPWNKRVINPREEA